MQAGLLFRLAADRAGALSAVSIDHALTEPFPHADPYLLASALQKAIRRGEVSVARRAGHQLLAMDRSRLWRRLMTVALEDIGIADIDVAAELVAISTLPAARRLLGGDRHALDIALARACASAKDRTGDHLASIIGREPITEMNGVPLKTASPNALLAMIASSDLPWERRSHAAVIASGLSETAQLGAAGITVVLDVFHELGVPCALLLACEAYATRSRDPLPVLVPFAAHLRAATERLGSEPRTVVHDLRASASIGGWPDWTFDPLWTRIGKRAVELWLRSYLAKPQWLPRQVAACLWNAESAACDRTLSWPLGDVIRERAHAADLSFRGLPRQRHVELAQWIDRERSHLTCAREAAFRSTVRASAKPAEVLEQANLPLPVPPRPQRHD